MAKPAPFASFKDRRSSGSGDVFRPFTASGRIGLGRHKAGFRSLDDNPGEQAETPIHTETGPLSPIEEPDRPSENNVHASASDDTTAHSIADAENQKSGPEEFLSDTEIAKALGDIPAVKPEVKKPQEMMSGPEIDDTQTEVILATKAADNLLAFQAEVPTVGRQAEPSAPDPLIQTVEQLSWQLDQIGEEIQTKVAAEIFNNLIGLLRPLVEARYREKAIASLCAEVTAIVKREGVGTLHVHCPAHLAKMIKGRLSPQALKSVVIEATGSGDDLRLEYADTAVVSRVAELAGAFERAMNHE